MNVLIAEPGMSAGFGLVGCTNHFLAYSSSGGLSADATATCKEGRLQNSDDAFAGIIEHCDPYGRRLCLEFSVGQGDWGDCEDCKSRHCGCDCAHLGLRLSLGLFAETFHVG